MNMSNVPQQMPVLGMPKHQPLKSFSTEVQPTPKPEVNSEGQDQLQGQYPGGGQVKGINHFEVMIKTIDCVSPI